MDHKDESNEIKEYADGWITERKGTDVPAFLKAAFVVIALGCVAYLVVYMNGETSNEERGALVRAFNDATRGSDAFMYGVAGIALVYAVALFAFTFRKFED
jgi:hypothetical protein